VLDGDDARDLGTRACSRVIAAQDGEEALRLTETLDGIDQMLEARSARGATGIL
jgi:hypothetical protein